MLQGGYAPAGWSQQGPSAMRDQLYNDHSIFLAMPPSQHTSLG